MTSTAASGESPPTDLPKPDAKTIEIGDSLVAVLKECCSDQLSDEARTKMVGASRSSRSSPCLAALPQAALLCCPPPEPHKPTPYLFAVGIWLWAHPFPEATAGRAASRNMLAGDATRRCAVTCGRNRWRQAKRRLRSYTHRDAHPGGKFVIAPLRQAAAEKRQVLAGR